MREVDEDEGGYYDDEGNFVSTGGTAYQAGSGEYEQSYMAGESMHDREVEMSHAG